MDAEQDSQQVKKVPIMVKGANEFNLIYVSKPKKKKERMDSKVDKEQIKVKLPLKVLAQKLVDNEESKQHRDSPEKGLSALKIT